MQKSRGRVSRTFSWKEKEASVTVSVQVRGRVVGSQVDKKAEMQFIQAIGATARTLDDVVT